MRRVALVTGANRGLGLATARALGGRGYTVVLTSRRAEQGAAAAEALRSAGLEEVDHQTLDVTDQGSVDALHTWLLEQHGRLDVLVNNAGVQLDPLAFEDPVGSSLFNTDLALVERTHATNFYGPFRLMKAFVPGMIARNYGRVVNVSSMLGSLGQMGGKMPGYRSSKTALNALTRIAAGETGDSDVLVNSVCPGWVRTDLGGANADKSPEEGAEIIVWAATLETGGPSGGFFRDGERFAW